MYAIIALRGSQRSPFPSGGYISNLRIGDEITAKWNDSAEPKDHRGESRNLEYISNRIANKIQASSERKDIESRCVISNRSRNRKSQDSRLGFWDLNPASKHRLFAH